MRRFIDLLQQGLIRQHRTVEYYASRLNITPNYLTECCIKTSRHNASFFIEHFTAEEIARLLKREDLSITDVAYQLDFNTTNYFTRYVKRVLGMTPSQYKAKFSVKKIGKITPSVICIHLSVICLAMVRLNRRTFAAENK